jgi:BASS family bile acid:Na+ symporter
MQGDVLTSVILPLGLALIMFTLGTGLQLLDFKRVFLYPKAFSIGLICQFLLLPLITFTVIGLFGVTGAIAVGFMIIAACPTGSTSNLFTYHARADVALALSFTAVSGVVAIVTVPLILSWSLTYFMDSNQQIRLPYSMVMGQIFMLLGVPVGLGMLFRAKAPAWTKRFGSTMSLVSTLIFLGIFAAAVAKNWSMFQEHGLVLAPLVFFINVMMLSVGFALPKFFGVPLRQAATVAIESAIQNGTLAIVIASSILMNDVMAAPAAIYSVLMYVSGIPFVFVIRRYMPFR